MLDTSFMGDWVTHLVSTFGSAASGGVRYYQLDNEPDNWQALRTDIYPALYPPGTWCEPFYTTNTSIGTSLNQDFINRTMAYAKAIKAADPTASVLFMSHRERPGPRRAPQHRVRQPRRALQRRATR